MAQSTDAKKTEKSYLSTAVDSLSSWGRTTEAPPPEKTPTSTPARVPSPSRANDHSTNPLYGISWKRYPPDCPPLNVLWFHGADVPKRKPKFLSSRQGKAAGKDKDKEKLPTPPKKYVAFQPSDSRAIEESYQQLLEEQEERAANPRRKRKHPPVASHDGSSDKDAGTDAPFSSPTHVPVNEDFLFDVDILHRELSPVYWIGPVYDVRRGTWFYQEGSTLRPCEENLAAQLEEGYLKTKPWLITTASSTAPPAEEFKPSKDAPEKDSAANGGKPAPPPAPELPSYRLFGTYMNSAATYQDGTTAWISSDGILSWVTSSVYQRFSGGGYMSGVKVVRGYSDTRKPKEGARPSTPTNMSTDKETSDEKREKALKRKSAPPSTRAPMVDGAAEGPRSQPFGRDSKKLEEEIRQRQESEIRDDYNTAAEETQEREIEHLVLVTHGIGQLLSLRLESMNFIHDVNVLRKTMKAVYSNSGDLKALNGEVGGKTSNCRVQVLPVCWRHHLDFPRKRDDAGLEHDIGAGNTGEDAYPTLEDITVEGVAFARSIVSDLALDVLLYQSGYREQIMTIVVKEANRIYHLFKKRNPDFKGKVHLMGHSLGSAILFDLLCRQRERPQSTPPRSLRPWQSSREQTVPKEPSGLHFDFEVDDFYCLGSPIGLFQMLKGRTISARNSTDSMPSMSPLNPDEMENPFQNMDRYSEQRISPVTGLPYSVSAPCVAQLFNIFHPSDPISYRVEPLISPVMSSLKPQALPYTKKGIFGSVAPQGLSGIGAKVGQSVSGLWSSLSAGVASSLLNKSLGLTSEEVARMNAASSPGADRPPAARAEPASSGRVIADTSGLGERTNQLQKELASRPGGGPDRKPSMSGNDATLIDYELETLYTKFEKGRSSDSDGGEPSQEDRDEAARKMRFEEAKVRALNRNGRVDYNIQESVMDYNPINTIASHMSYWADEDVNHFVLSQLLSNRTRTRSI